MPEPGAGDVLVRVHATTVNRTDCGFRDPRPFFVRAFSGLVRPKHRILGTEFAGVVAAVGADVTTFAVGDRVFGVNADHFGAHAEYLRVAATAPIATMPDGMTFDEAAAICDGAVLARTCLTKSGVTAGTKLMIYGATGSIGTAAVQLATHLGADVTAVCRGEHADLVRALGADRVIDYDAPRTSRAPATTSTSCSTPSASARSPSASGCCAPAAPTRRPTSAPAGRTRRSRSSPA